MHLLDANVLIALSDAEHVHHAVASSWLASARRFATCPVTQGALVRYLVRSGASVGAARSALQVLAAHPRHEFWPDSLAYADADLSNVVGHRQVTDAYLVSLARQHGRTAKLATLDEPLARLYPNVVTLLR